MLRQSNVYDMPEISNGYYEPASHIPNVASRLDAADCANISDELNISDVLSISDTRNISDARNVSDRRCSECGSTSALEARYEACVMCRVCGYTKC